MSIFTNILIWKDISIIATHFQLVLFLFFPPEWHHCKPVSSTTLPVTHWTKSIFSVRFNWSCKLQRFFDCHFCARSAYRAWLLFLIEVFTFFFFFSEYVNIEIKRMSLWSFPALFPCCTSLLGTSAARAVQRRAPSLCIPWMVWLHFKMGHERPQDKLLHTNEVSKAVPVWAWAFLVRPPWMKENHY